MKQRLILDKSAVRALGYDGLRKAGQKYSFLFPYVLWFEIQTDSDPKWPVSKWTDLLKTCGGVCKQEIFSLVTWEMEHGRSAIECHGFSFHPCGGEWQSQGLSGTSMDSLHAEFLRGEVSKGNRTRSEKLHRMQGQEFFDFLRNHFQCSPLAKYSKQMCQSRSKRMKIPLHKSFSPGPSWYCWGYCLVRMAFQYFIEHKWGIPQDSLPKKHEAANYVSDFDYLPYLVEADGFASNDKISIPIAKACWSEKAKLIITPKELLASL